MVFFMGKWTTKAELTDLLCDLVKIPSVTLSAAEVELPKFVIEELGTLDYFKQHPDHLRTNPTGDGRSFVTALVKRSDDVRKTVILVSHFDVVDVQDYGAWKNDAFDAKKLTADFYSRKDEMPAEVQKDMESGNWLFGRGTMDMKCGLALHMAMVAQACEGRFDGNILLLAVPDEEVNSVGMRAAVPVLLEMAEEYGLEFTTVLNSEPMFTRYPGDQNNYIYTGSIGKVLPGFLCYGKETHVGEPFSGLNASLMASQVTSEFELNTDFCEQVEGEVTPPPTNLMQRDLKEEYSVQIPHRAVTLFNLFLLEKSMDQVVEPLLAGARRAAERIKIAYASRAASFAKLDRFTPPELDVRVLTYEELYQYAIKTHGKMTVDRLQKSVLDNRGNQDDRDISIRLVDQMSILCKELSPMIVLFFAPPYYPAVSSRKNRLIEQVVGDMIGYAKEKHAVTLRKQNYFGGISDLSYVGLQYPAVSLRPLVANMPLWDRGYSLPLAELEQFDVPVLNLGPVGRDAHQWTERLHLDYAFDTLYDMLPVCIEKLLR